MQIMLKIQLDPELSISKWAQLMHTEDVNAMLQCIDVDTFVE